MKPLAIVIQLVFILLISLNSFSQELDSLKRKLNNETQLLQQLELLTAITSQSMFASLDSTKKYGELMMEYAEKGTRMEERIMHPLALHLIGTSFYIKNEIDSASIVYLEAIDKYQRLIDKMGGSEKADVYWECIKRKSRSYNNLALCYYSQSVYDTAIIYFHKAIDLNLQLIDVQTEWSESAKMDIGGTYVNIAGVMERQNEYTQALSYGWKAKSYLEDSDNKRALMNCYNNLGAYNSFINELDSALFYYDESLAIALELGDQYLSIYIQGNMGSLYLRLEQWKLSIEFLSQAHRFHSVNNNPTDMFANEVALTEAYFGVGNYDSSLHYLDKVLTYGRISGKAEDKEGALGLAMQIYSGLARKKPVISMYDSALKYSELYHAMNDSLFNETKDKNLKELEVKFDTEQKEKANILLQKQNEKQRLILTFLTILGFLLLSILFVIYKFYVARKKVALKLAEDKVLITSQANKLKALDQFKSRFFANVSHDLRTPLTLIQGHIFQLKNDDNYLNTKSEQSLDKLETNTLKLIRLTDEIKDLIQLENDKLSINYQRVNIKPYLQTLINLFSSAAELKKIDLQFNTDIEEELLIHLDPSLVEKIIYNIIANALRFTSLNGHIHVWLERIENSIEISIADDGAGIPQEKIEYIFERFYQGDNEANSKSKGIGIGLALVLELVKLHEGSIKVESEVGKGTKFTVVLPFNLDKRVVASEEVENYVVRNRSLLVEEESISEGLVDLNETAKHSDNAKIVLIVDDHPDIRHYIQELIQDNYIIRQAGNGKEALDVLRREKIDAVITDLMMPWMDGHELIDEMKENDSLNKVPVLVVSARTTEEDKLKVLEHGINDFLAKPFHPDDLRLRIENLIANGNSIEIWDEIASDKKKLNEIEKNILSKLNSLILTRIDDSSLSVKDLADELVTSSRNAFTMISQMTGMGPKDYIDEVRIRYTEDLIKKKKVRSVTEAAQAVGMSNSTHFSRKFEKKTGKHPSELFN